MMQQAAGWAVNDRKTSSPIVVMSADKSKPLKFNEATPQRDECVDMFACVCGGMLRFLWDFSGM